MENLLDSYGNHHCHCRKFIDIEHVITLYVLDLAVHVLGRDHVDPYVVREKLFKAVLPLMYKYPAVKAVLERWLVDPEYRGDECLEDLRELAEKEVFGDFGDLEC